MVDETAKISAGRTKAVIPKIKSGQDLLVDPPHLQPEPAADGRAVQGVEAVAPASTLEAIGAPAVDLSKPELETLATAPQDTAADLHLIALAKTGGTETTASAQEQAETVAESSEPAATAEPETPPAVA